MNRLSPLSPLSPLSSLSRPLSVAIALAFVLFSLPGCPGDDEVSSQGSSSTTSLSQTDSSSTASSTDASTSEEGSTSTTGEEGSTSTTGGLEALPVDRSLIDRYAGAWSGPVTMTPWGEIPYFPVDLVWEGEDLLASETLIPDTDGYFRFRFVHEGSDMWSLVEEGKIPGGPTQSYTLHPVEIDGDTSRWVYLDEPDFLALQLTVSDAELVMETYLHGAPHATFNLAR